MSGKQLSGILLPISALPAKDIGNFGEVAVQFLEQCVKAGQKIWQVLPIGPTIIHDSPFYSPSAFAISPNYIALEDLVSNPERSLLSQTELAEYYQKFAGEDPNRINYGLLWEQKMPLLRKAFARFLDKGGLQHKSFLGFLQKHEAWLENYVQYMGIKEVHLGKPERETWVQWNDEFKNKEMFDKRLAEFFAIADKNKDAPEVKTWQASGWDAQKLTLYREIVYQANFHRFLQWVAFSQWYNLQKLAREKNIRLIGDCPIYVSPDSADVWANREVFKLDEKGNQTCFAGVPPDYFSPKYGQFWGNPIYRWFKDEKNQEWNDKAFAWWAKRLQYQLALFDELRIDHFRGFSGYWEVPCDKCDDKDENGKPVKTAKYGEWKKGPGVTLFEHVARLLEKNVRELPIIAEDLGVITPDVTAVRTALNAPGMGVFQFAPWADACYQDQQQKMAICQAVNELAQAGIDLATRQGWDKLCYRASDDKQVKYLPFMQHEFLPQNARTSGKLVFYPGTHDNETLVGWFNDPDKPQVVREMLQSYLNYHLTATCKGKAQIKQCLAEPLHWQVIRTLSGCPAVEYTIFQMQDILGLPNADEKRGVKMRMNIPNQKGQWQWKMGGTQVFTQEIQEKLYQISRHSKRVGD
jgi:4-alpha-glucanotransferase